MYLAIGKADHLFLQSGIGCFLPSSSVKDAYLFSCFLFWSFYIFMKNPVDNPLLPIFSKPQKLPPKKKKKSFLQIQPGGALASGKLQVAVAKTVTLI